MSISQDEVRIDGRSLQLEGRIAFNYQGVDLSDQTVMRDNYTHTIEIPVSRLNEEILGYPSDPRAKADEIGAYSEKKADIYIGGSLVLRKGPIMLTQAGETIKLNVVGPGTTFWDTIRDKSIKELTWGGVSSVTFSDTLYSGQDIIYPIMETWLTVDYTAASPAQGNMNFEKLVSRTSTSVGFVRLRRVMEEIMRDAGFTLDYTYLRLWAGDDRINSFEQAYISMLFPSGKRDNYLDNTIMTSEWLHDINQAAFIKGILYMYGAILVQDGRVIYMVLLEEITHRKSGKGLNWSGKVNLSITPEKTYENGYAKSNRWQYLDWSDEMRAKIDTYILSAASNSATPIYPGRIGFRSSDNQNLEESRIVGEIPWSLCPMVQIRDVNNNPREIPYLPAWDDSAGSSGEFTGDWDPVVLVIPNEITTYRTSGGAAQTWFGLGNGLKVGWSGEQEDQITSLTNGQEGHGLSFDQKLMEFFYGFDTIRFIRQPLVVECVMNLSVEDLRDVNNLESFAKHSFYLNDYIPKILPVFIEELNGWFIVKKISSFVAGDQCKVTLIRI